MNACVCACACVHVCMQVFHATLFTRWCSGVAQDELAEVHLFANTTHSLEGTVPGVKEVFGYFPSGLIQWYTHDGGRLFGCVFTCLCAHHTHTHTHTHIYSHNTCSLLVDYPPHAMFWSHATHGLVAWQHMDGSSVLISSAVKEATWNTTIGGQSCDMHVTSQLLM